ncbi:hypothetical protein [Fuscibacter oryzae]|uniref:Uncharacterized protein n=1 Tax=Fuscibacter oryzae TaxID=2803939 RepID=A0A8J7MRK2_9RHOB|nr:hypothetical protein [Fuscibacter oryzae]MBL4928633.1 hypothetical protein [Fuscibacter oryzae]
MKRLITATAIALWGGVVMWAMDPVHPDTGMIVAALGGAFLSGLASAPLFLRQHWGWSALGAVCATCGGAALGGALLATVGLPSSPVQGMALGIALVGAGILQSPVVFLTWLAGAVAVASIAPRAARFSP